MSRTFSIKSQFIRSVIFDLAEKATKDIPFEFKTDNLREQTPTLENYCDAKKIGILMVFVNHDDTANVNNDENEGKYAKVSYYHKFQPKATFIFFSLSDRDLYIIAIQRLRQHSKATRPG